MIFVFDELPEWTFEVLEVSMGVYRVTGRDRDGRLVENTGTNDEVLLAGARDAAATIRSSVK
jgi:hypothetical protein